MINSIVKMGRLSSFHMVWLGETKSAQHISPLLVDIVVIDSRPELLALHWEITLKVYVKLISLD
jgi:hypothetical protein